MKFLTATIFTFLIALQIVASISDGVGDQQIIQGDCSSPDETKLVYRDHVVKNAIPFVTREETVKYSGDLIIYCLMATSDASNNSTAELTAGGVDHKFVTLDLKSSKGHSLNYYVYVYAD